MIFWIILSLSVPIFYVVGFFTVVVAMVRAFSKPHGAVQQPANNRLEAALRTAMNDRPELNRAQIAALLDWSARNDNIPLPNLDLLTGAAAEMHISQPAPVATDTILDSFPQRNSGQIGLGAAPGYDVVQPTVRPVSKPIDNANLLLFLGAFMLVVSAGIFVGVNYDYLSGVAKTVVLAVIALAFYISGMVLYRLNTKYLPAATTFTAIGLIILPLVGLAMYNFVFEKTQGPTIWFVTSLISLVLYIFTLWRTKQTFVAYFVAAMALSSFESTTWLFGQPVYWFGWGMVIVALGLMLLSRWKPLWRDTAESLAISAQIFLPLALIFSVGMIAENGLNQFGITLFLSAIYYGLMASQRPRDSNTGVYYVIALCLLPLSMVTGWWDDMTHMWLAVVIIFVAVAYHLMARYGEKFLVPAEREVTALISGLTALSAALLMSGTRGPLAACLLLAVIISLDLALVMRNTAVLVLAIFGAMFLPPALANSLYISDNLVFVAAGYLALSVGIFALRLLVGKWVGSAKAVSQGGYLLAAVFSLGMASSSGAQDGILFGCILALVLYGMSYFEERPWLVAVAGGVLYIGLWQINLLSTRVDSAATIAMILISAVLAMLGFSVVDKPRAMVLRYVAIAGAVFGAIAGASFDTVQYAPIVSLALSGVLVWLEGQKLDQEAIKNVAAGIWTIALLWLWSYLGFSETQVYMVTIAVYGAWLTSRYWGQEVARNVLMASTLFVLTVPLAGQALAEDGQIYSLALIGESIVLLFAGMMSRIKLMTYWGATALVAEVLYQMREVLFAIPKYLISAGIGITLIVVAIVVLGRRKND